MQGHELWPTGTHLHPVPAALFPGMLVPPCHSQTPGCHPRPRPLITRNSISTRFKNPPISRYQRPIASLGLSHPYFQFSALVANANTWVSLPLQLMKATVLTESYNYLSIFIVMSTPAVYWQWQGRYRSLSFLLTCFLYVSTYTYNIYNKIQNMQ